MSKKQSSNSANNVFISISDASKQSGYTRGHLYSLINKKKISFQKNEKGIYVSLGELLTRAEENKNKIKKTSRKRKYFRKVASVTPVKETQTTSSNSFEGIVFILAGVLGLVIGYLIANALK